MERLDVSEENDYENLKAIARAHRERREFYPIHTTITAVGDPRIALGKKFTIVGPRVPGGTKDLVCAEVTHRIDSHGYNMDIVGIRKFVLP